jgi:hypothetical protein
MLAEIRAATTAVAHVAPEAITRDAFPWLPARRCSTKSRPSSIKAWALPSLPASRSMTIRRTMRSAPSCGISTIPRRHRRADLQARNASFTSPTRASRTAATRAAITRRACCRSIPTARTSPGCCAWRRRTRGGESLLASSISTTTRSRAASPNASPRWQGFIHDRRGDHAPGENPVSPERIRSSVSTRACSTAATTATASSGRRTSPERSSPPTRSRRSTRSIEIVAIPRFHVSMDMKKGDMQFVNNFVILHSRTEYEDHEDGGAAISFGSGSTAPTAGAAARPCSICTPRASGASRSTRRRIVAEDRSHGGGGQSLASRRPGRALAGSGVELFALDQVFHVAIEHRPRFVSEQADAAGCAEQQQPDDVGKERRDFLFCLRVSVPIATSAPGSARARPAARVQAPV